MTVQVYRTIVRVLDWFKHPSQLAINGLLTVNAGWGVYCFVEEEEGAYAGSELPQGGPEPQARRLPKKREGDFPVRIINESAAFLWLTNFQSATFK
jgi:hypothetical protein